MSENVVIMPPVCAYCILEVAKPDTTLVVHINSYAPELADGTDLSAVDLELGTSRLIIFRSGESQDLTGELQAEEFMCLAPLVGRIGYWELNGRRIAPSLVTRWQGTTICGMHLLMVSARAPDNASSLSETMREG